MIDLGILNRIPNFAELVEPFEEAGTDEWTIVLWLLTENPDLNERVPLMALWTDPEDKDLLVALAKESAWRLH